MTRRRWIADEISGNRASLTGDHARHLAQVLRAKVGQEFDISTGVEARRGRVVSVHPERVECELGEVVSEPSPSVITVAISIFKFDRMEWAIEKCTELGVARIIPVIAARTEKHLAEAGAKRVERWRKIAAQAAEQSRRVSAPQVAEPIRLKDLIGTVSDTKIVLCETEAEVMLKDVLPVEAGSLVLAFGPEGGWSEKERSMFKEAKWTSVSLGPRILRTETAVVAAVAISEALSVM